MTENGSKKNKKKRTFFDFVTIESEYKNIWLTVYSDMMTNLTLFFLLLFATTRLTSEQKDTMYNSIESKFKEGKGKAAGTKKGGAVEKGGEKETGDDEGRGKDGKKAEEDKGIGKGERAGVGDKTGDKDGEKDKSGSGEKEEVIEQGEEAGKEQGKSAAKAEEELAQKMKEELDRKGFGGDAQVKLSEQKIRIMLSSPVLFDIGKAELKESSFNILHQVALMIKPYPNRIVIEGHTDNIPIKTEEFDSNWELSAARAFSVVKYLIQKEGFPPGRLAGLGYGEFRPVYDNETEENRAKNRRIEVNIIRVAH